MREAGKDWTGNSVYLWAIAAAVYMALLGPKGFARAWRADLARSHYAARRLGVIAGVKLPFAAGFFKEFVVNFDATGRSVAEINRRLLDEHAIFGGKDLSNDLPELGQSALYCVTEIHTAADIDRLVAARDGGRVMSEPELRDYHAPVGTSRSSWSWRSRAAAASSFHRPSRR